MANITITNFQNTKYYGIFSDGGVWTQADGLNAPTHFAVLDEIPTANGTYSGTVYAEDDTFTPNNTIAVTARPITTGVTTGNIVTVSDGTEGTATVLVNGFNQFDTEHIDNSNLLDNIMQLYRR